MEPTIPPIVVQHQQQLAAAASTASAMIATAAQQASSRPTQQHNQQLNHSIASMTGAGSSTKAHPLPVTQHDHNMPSHQQQKAASTTSNVTQTASALNFSKAALNAMGNSHQVCIKY